ncbi:FecR domain-containing protein [Sorangium sp. So ce1335]|uniref:FecR domain-containing protein n=1 Tax=Sorangium sp. So ce1335 TaxID=3133335 RepID=UPI003F5E8ED6
MDPVTRRIEPLGAEVARTSDRRARPAETLAAARARLFAAEAEAPPRRARPAVLAAAAAALLLAAGGAALLGSSWAPPRGLELAASSAAPGGAPAPGAGARVEARDAPLAFTFAEGTTVRLDAASALQVLATDARGAELRVERGGVDFHVVHRSDTRWVVHAGPYAVRVTGTRFEARWSPEARRFTLALAEGSVEVTGPELGTARLSAGDRLDLTAPGAPAASGAAAAPPAGAPAAAAPPPEEDRAARPPAAGATDAAPRWQSLASAGRHEEALAVVERLGLDAVLARAAPDELRLLADAARYAGRPLAARAALLALRKRHGARGDSAFLLGKLAADQLDDPADALGWFDTYLREAPGGALREQALGRSLELQRRQDREVARRAALRYLAEYPHGAYAPLARSLADAR